MNQIPNIPAEKFRLAQGRDLQHDSKLSTKPVSYFQGAFRRFCKNKGAAVAAVIILCLVLFSIFAPFFTPFTPEYYDMVYGYVTPKMALNLSKPQSLHLYIEMVIINLPQGYGGVGAKIRLIKCLGH